MDKQSDSTDWLDCGRRLSSAGRKLDALDAYDRFIARYPFSAAPAFVERGVVLAALGRQADAFASFERAISLQPKSVDAWNNKGQLLAEIYRRTKPFIGAGNYEKILASCDGVVCENHFDWIDRGFALCALGRYEEALTSFDQALEMQPKSLEAWNNKGWTLTRLRRYKEAVLAYSRALDIDPKCALSLDGKKDARTRADSQEQTRRAPFQDLRDGWVSVCKVALVLIAPFLVYYGIQAIPVSLYQLPSGVTGTCVKCGRPATRAPLFVVSEIETTGGYEYLKGETLPIYCDQHAADGNADVHPTLTFWACLTAFILPIWAFWGLGR